MKNFSKIIILVFSYLSLSACEFVSGSSGKTVTDSQQSREFDGIKMIAEHITDPIDPVSIDRDIMDVGPSSHVLVRYMELMSIESDFRTESGHKVELTLGTNQKPEEVIKTLKACPITQLWNMRATWNHPFGFRKQGWTPGGALDTGMCATATLVKTSSGVATGEISFDITPWLLNYVRAKRINYGLALISDLSVTVYGNQDSTRSPRIKWIKTTTSR
ncbi:MAG: hypothetical protein JNL01_11710 [Bdellovibrionales bacterium]|nr:hypothetical protein [Bdellovibrionales bacterium]